ncbi:MAG: 4Fe-4S dicluster domain-containing protein [Defluviitaleaceae bacterium]|nr:4Fe-4S dicluster domain-containing protein [Defluviitaleaceae bacterium]
MSASALNDIREEVLRISGANPKKCMSCGKCSASCPASFEMDILPHHFVKNIRDGNIENLLKSKTLWKCLSCFACVERCPRAVEPANLVEAVRLAVIRKKGENYLKVDDIPEFIELDNEIPQQLIVSAFRKYSK